MIAMRVLMNLDESRIIENVEAERNMSPEHLADVTAVGALPRGTASGQPAIIVRMDPPDGKFLIGQTSLKAFVSAARAFAAKYEDFL
jgi:hypothetical protein